jgi:hypothetical protein
MIFHRYLKDLSGMIRQYQGIEEKVFGFVSAMREETTGKYRISISNQGDLYACTYVPQILSVLNAFDRFSPEDRQRLANRIQAYQEASGYFEEYISRHWTPNVLEINRLLMTSLSASSLALLGYPPSKKMAFLANVMTPAGMRSWFDERRRFALMANGSWNESIATECIALCLMVHAYYSGIEIQKWDVFQVYFECLESLQDKYTGFWGTHIGIKKKVRQHFRRVIKGVPPNYLTTGMGTTFHMVDIYAAVGRPLRYAAKIVQNTIKCQQADGLFHPDGGGSQCHDLDAISILSNLYNSVPQSLQKRILEAAKKTMAAFSDYGLQNADGGFRNRAGGQPYQKGDSPLYIKRGESDLLSTWFRAATIAYIDLICTGQTKKSIQQWQFPKIGFLHHSQVTSL